ncbi:permease [Mobiluncus mulieris]|uniref:Uncharacterized protein n=2 Tax=Mobiluncus mulieris TaxID=2052 RepID=E0QP61_9ACTO|nr:hypothetical protein HMPREF0577_0042 [Mobiluncus mulieris ATCC 35243]EFM46628.1 hypothetical protein HMPREF0580_0675 [Mobiluncus mulieris ATCC 35239]MCU9971295.1 permease [Mobiluncus mulieris]MCU9975562.1 permease [Mobiluncus mulieris]MCU9994172.1 permease [Mobiluncus mulieris]
MVEIAPLTIGTSGTRKPQGSLQLVDVWIHMLVRPHDDAIRLE